MLQSSTPLLHQVIPLFDGLTRALDDHASDPMNAPAVRMAAIRGRTMLNKYYGLSDDSVMYRIAMCMSLLICPLLKIDRSFNLVLHPRYKSSYFLKAGWPREWVQTAEDLLRTEWEKNYKPKSGAALIAAVSLIILAFKYNSYNIPCSAYRPKINILRILTLSMPPSPLTLSLIG